MTDLTRPRMAPAADRLPDYAEPNGEPERWAPRWAFLFIIGVNGVAWYAIIAALVALTAD